MPEDEGTQDGEQVDEQTEMPMLDGDEGAVQEGQQAQEQEQEQEEVAAQQGESVEERARRLEMENLYLRGQRDRDEQIRQQQVKAAQPRVEDDDDDPVEFGNALQRDPVGTLRAREDRLLGKFEQMLEKKLSSHAQVQKQMTLDERLAYERFPALATHEEFRQRQQLLYSRMVEEFGERPGLNTLAAATAYGEMVDMGKLEPRGRQQPNGNGQQRPVVQTRQAVRRVAQQPMVRTSTATTSTGSGKDPFDGLSQKDRIAAQAACQSLGVTPEQWRKNYDEYKEELV